MASPPRHVNIVELMADYSLTYNPLFFGQFSLIQDWAARWSTLDHRGQKTPVRRYYVGSRVAGPRALVSPDPTTDADAYADALAGLCAEGAPVVALSHFIHKDAVALRRLLDLRFPNFHLIVILHCTRDEFLRPWSGPEPAQTARARRQARRAEAFRSSLRALAGEEGADCFVAVSEPTRQSYIDEAGETPIPSHRIVTISNGVDARHYRPLARHMRSRRRASLGLEGLVVGCTNRWTQAKGKDILEALLDRLERDAGNQNVTFLFPSLVHDQMFAFLESLPGRYPRLYRSGRVKAFVDLSKLTRSVFPCDMDDVRRSYRREIDAQPAPVRTVFEEIFLGFLDHPVHTLLDVYLRPSVAEAFGLGIVEAYLCGVPVLASDRGGCRRLVLPEHQVHLEAAVDLRGHGHHHADPAYHAGVARAADGFLALLRSPSTFQTPAKRLRSRMIAEGFTTDGMIRRYNRLLGRILDACDEYATPA